LNTSRPKQAAGWLGLDPSVRAAEARFRGTDWEYWRHWCSSRAPYETYAAWLDSLKRDSVAALASIWKGRSDATDRWFQSTCAPAIEKALAALVKLRIRQARDVEFRRIPPGTTTRLEGIVGGTMAESKDDLLRLPKGIESSDPVDGNPFSEDDLRHGFWDRATREAEEGVCRLNADFVKARPSGLEEIMPFDMAYFTSKYDIWAKRGVRVVLARDLIASWDQWLANYANETLKTFKAISPPELALQKLRDMLVGRREHWRAEGRRNVALQEAHHAELAKHAEFAEGVPGSAIETPARDAELPPLPGNAEEGIGANRAKVTTKSDKPLGTDHGASKWEDIEILFLSDHKIQIKIGSSIQPPQNYAEMGFASKKSNNPVAAWETLRDLAQHCGALRLATDSAKWTKVEKRIQEIRKAFRVHFALSGDPFSFTKKSRRNADDFGYRAKFKISCHSSFEA